MSGYNLQPFDGKTDFSIWQQKMKGILIQQKVFKAIDGKYSETVSEEKRLENDEYAYSSIILNLSDSVIRKVGKQNSAKELWNKLEELFTETSLPSKLFLLEKFFRYKLDISKNIEENIDEFTKLVQDIKLTGDKNIDDYTPIVLLNAIPESYSDVKAAIKYGRDNVSLETVISGLKSKEMDLKTNAPSTNSNEVNFARGRTKSRSNDSDKNHKYRKHSKSRSRSRGRSPSRSKNHNKRNDKKDYKCYNCGGRGHFIKDCKKPKKNNQNDSANVSEETSDEVYMISETNLVDNSNKFEWLVDSGCTFHMTPYKDILMNFKTEKLGSVSMANQKLCDVLGFGDIFLKFENGSKLTLRGVRYVPDLAHNLLSCSALEEDGLEGRWGKGVMRITKGSLTIFKAEKKRNLYLCKVQYDLFSGNVSEISKSDLWHKRLGHISLKGLELLHKNGFLHDKPTILNFCDECILGKQHKVSFPTSSYPVPTSSKCILDYVHADVWGPANIGTHGGNKYFLSIIDNYSRKVFVFLMKQKSDVFEKFQSWKNLVENQTGFKLRALRTDNGLEFCNKQFSELCEKYGIKRHKTTPYTPQQNGVAERMNRTLLNKVRCLLISSGLPKTFWGEALLTAAYLINRSPSVPLFGNIPEKLWSNTDVDLSSLRIFGCSAFCLVNGDKLDPRSQKCVFIGYPIGVKGYRLWLRNQPGFKVVVSRDVIFNESEMPCLNTASKTTENYNIENTFNKVEPNTLDNQQGEDLGDREENQEDHNEIENEVNSENSYQLVRDRVPRQRRIPTRLRDYHLALNAENIEPNSYEEALENPHSKEWLSAMHDEIKALKKNKTWVLVPKPENVSVIDCKWVFKVKEEDNKKRFKARLVAKGFTQKEGIDYTEIFSPVVKFTTVRILLALVAQFNWELKQMDVKTAFLHGNLDEKIYMSQPYGFVDKKNSDLLSKDQCPKTDSEKEKMNKVPYSNAIGSVMYLMVSTRPDIAYSVSCLSRYMSNPGSPHWEALKHLLRYLNGTKKLGINFSKSPNGAKLVGYVDSNYANDRDSRKSTTSYIFTLCDACISWKSQLQNIMALSTTEAEYIATTEAIKEAIWLKGLLSEIGFLKEKLTVFSDSQSSIQLCKNPVFHYRTKHIDVRDHPLGDDESLKPTTLVWTKVEIVGKIWPKPKALGFTAPEPYSCL
ncbi:UNVERIFIED_CONTAM: Retrovirus-related Pol polyprotein from transposon TNT 1-94 [Sesamum indicum]